MLFFEQERWQSPYLRQGANINSLTYLLTYKANPVRIQSPYQKSGTGWLPKCHRDFLVERCIGDKIFMRIRSVSQRYDWAKLWNNSLFCNMENSSIMPDPDLEADHFQNLTSSSLSTDTSFLVKFSWRPVHSSFYAKLLTDRQTNAGLSRPITSLVKKKTNATINSIFSKCLYSASAVTIESRSVEWSLKWAKFTRLRILRVYVGQTSSFNFSYHVSSMECIGYHMTSGTVTTWGYRDPAIMECQTSQLINQKSPREFIYLQWLNDYEWPLKSSLWSMANYIVLGLFLLHSHVKNCKWTKNLDSDHFKSNILFLIPGLPLSQIIYFRDSSYLD